MARLTIIVLASVLAAAFGGDKKNKKDRAAKVEKEPATQPYEAVIRGVADAAIPRATPGELTAAVKRAQKEIRLLEKSVEGKSRRVRAAIDGLSSYAKLRQERIDLWKRAPTATEGWDRKVRTQFGALVKEIRIVPESRSSGNGTNDAIYNSNAREARKGRIKVEWDRFHAVKDSRERAIIGMKARWAKLPGEIDEARIKAVDAFKEIVGTGINVPELQDASATLVDDVPGAAEELPIVLDDQSLPDDPELPYWYY